MMIAVGRVEASPRAKAAAIMAVIGLQLAVPAIAMLTDDPPARFAFTMYSGQGQVVVLIQDADGQEVPFDSKTAIAGMRAQIDWYDHLPSYLCRTVPDAQTVTVSQKGHESRLTCR
jgi:hypothetical protein